MAYVLWRIFTKKYAKVRLGIIANLPVIPAEKGVQIGGKKESESWSLMDKSVIEDSVSSKEQDNSNKDVCGGGGGADDDDNKEEENEKDQVDEAVEITRDQEGRRSRAKKVKNYLKKCKGALSSSGRDNSVGSNKRSGSGNKQQRQTTSSWYLQESSTTTTEGITSSEKQSQSKELNLENVLPTRTSSLNRSPISIETTSPRKFGSESLLDSIDPDDNFKKNDEKNNINTSQHRFNTQITQNQFIIGCPFLYGGRGDVASLVKSLLGPIYGDNVLDLLTRQARDILVCAYHGNLESFVEFFLSPASQLLTKLKNLFNKNDGCVPDGWPLTLAGRGLIIQLGELESCALRYGECYLCIRNKDNSHVGEFNSSVIKREQAIENKKVWKKKEEVIDKEEEEQVDIVEIVLIWRTSMRSPALLIWEYEDNYMDWKDYQIGAGSTSPVCRKRKKSHSELFTATDNICQEKTDDQLSKLPTMRLDQKNSNNSVGSSSNSSGNTEEAQINLQDLKKPIYLQSIINNKYNNELPMDLYAIGDKKNHEDLINLINTLLVTVERKIEHVNIDDIVFPCPACRNIDTDDPLLGCKCASGVEQLLKHNNSDDICDCDKLAIESNNSSMKTKTFEVPGIKHIDSDDEEEVRMGFGSKRREDIVPSPRSIHDLPERVLWCGLRLPGYTDDVNGRLVLEFENFHSNSKQVINPHMLCPREVASYILYLSKLYSSERTRNGWTLLMRGGSNDDFEALDKALILIQDRINIRQVLLLSNGEDSSDINLFPRTRLKIISVDDVTINQRIPKRRDGEYNHEEWITFYKEYDSLMNEWQSYGRQLVLEMSELKECTDITGSLTSLNRLLLESTSRKASESMLCLEERGEALSHLDYVSSAIERSKSVIKEVGDAATRLENCLEARRATIRNFSVLRTIEEQASEVLSWLCKKGKDILAKHARHAVTTLSAARLHERDFEKFYFTSMRYLDKGNDLAEAAGSSGLNELANSLREHLRNFGSKLEDRREFLEDTSRCYLLIDQAQQWIDNCQLSLEQKEGIETFENSIIYLPPEHFEEMANLVEKLENQILIEQCQIIRNKYQQLVELTKKNCQSPVTVRRSFTNLESTGESNLWDDNDSSGIMDNRSYSLSTDPSSNCQSGLDNMGEFCEGESRTFRTDSPSRNSPNRRLAKPPVNSHLQRSPSIAPAGMKAKKTILLIMREMIQTERDYVKSLEYIIENYIPELVREDIPQAMRGQRNVIFGNVEKIYEFHSQHFLRELEQCEQCPMNVGQCFLRHENKFYLYALYNKNKPNSDSLMAEYGTTFFKTKQLELGDKMDLASYLLKPVQRMGKYALLLQQLVKAGTDLSEQLRGKNNSSNDINNKTNNNSTTNNDNNNSSSNSNNNNSSGNNIINNNDNKIKEEENVVKPMVEGEADLRAAEQMVRFQLRHGNDLLAMDSLRDCDVNVKEQGRLLRQNEFLVWQGKGKKCLRQVFLFEDLILFSKARRFPDRKNLDIYIYKHSIKTTDIGLTAVIADSPTKFEIWFRKRKPGDTYTLQCASEDIKKSWTEELSNLLWKQALRNREVRLAEMSSMGIGNKPCLDIRPSADQINDRSISVAQLSKTPRFRNSIAVSISDDSNRCSRRPHSVISVSSSSSSGGSSGGPPNTLQLGLDASPCLHHRSTTLNSQCSIESGIIADISILSDDGVDGNHWKSTLESPTSSHPPNTSTPLQSLNNSYVLSPTLSNSVPVNSSSSSSTTSSSSSSTSFSTEANLKSSYDQHLSINL